MDFTTFRDAFFRYYGGQEYMAAFDLACTFTSDDPGIHAVLIVWKLCAASLAGKPDLVISVFQGAVDDGFFYTADGLRRDPDLAAMQDNPEYQRLVAICEQRYNDARENTKPQLFITLPETQSDAPAPLLMALHGWGQSMDDFSRHWTHLAEEGWLVALPQSSQVAGKAVHVWDHLDASLQEITAHYRLICEKYSVDTQRVILAGFSQGGGIAFWAALTQEISARGVIGLGPYLNTIETLAPTLSAPFIPNVRVYLASGAEENDEGIFAKMGALCNEKAVPFHHEIIPGIGHEFPQDFNQTLKRAFEFIG